MTERFKVGVDVQLLFIRDNKILLLLRQNTGYMDGMYGLPAGHVESGESIASAMVREAKEEAGLHFSEDNLVFSHVLHRKSTIDYVTFFFKLSNYTGPEPQNLEPEKCSKLEWFKLDELPENIIPWVGLGLVNSQNHIAYSEPDFE